MDGEISFAGSGNEEFTSRRLERAFGHVSDYWFPPNPELLSHIKSSLKTGVFDSNITALVDELRTDFSLFAFCLRELLKLLKEEGVVAPTSLSPLQMLEWGGITRLKAILDVQEKEISIHSFDSIEALQALRLQEAMTSASVTELLSSKKSVDPRLGFSVALLRQLGLTLIAWNYPSVYPEVMGSLNAGTSLDDALSEKLGFSPTLLGITITREWGLSPEIRTLVGESAAYSEISEERKNQVSEVSSTLADLCEIGETLARANDPEHYPSAQADWEKAKSRIERELGPEGLKHVQSRARENCENYLLVMPSLFKRAIKVDPQREIRLHKERKLLRANPYVEHCPEPLKTKIKDLYLRINSEPVTRDKVHQLVRGIIPLAGFTGGCIYTLDPGTLRLVPRVKLGHVELVLPKPLDYIADSLSSEIVTTAFVSKLPALEQAVLEADEPFSYMAGVRALSGERIFSYVSGVLGESKRIGVLYLEVEKDGLMEGQRDLLMHFKAIRQTLHDCLNLV